MEWLNSIFSESWPWFFYWFWIYIKPNIFQTWNEKKNKRNEMNWNGSVHQHWPLDRHFGNMNVKGKTEVKPTKTTKERKKRWKFNDTQKNEINDFLSITTVLTLTLESLFSESPAQSWKEKKERYERINANESYPCYFVSARVHMCNMQTHLPVYVCETKIFTFDSIQTWIWKQFSPSRWMYVCEYRYSSISYWEKYPYPSYKFYILDSRCHSSAIFLW